VADRRRPAGAPPQGPAPAWVTGADELGRPAEFRGWLRQHRERSILEVACNTSARDRECRRPPRRRAGRGRKREVPFRRADAWAARQPEGRWPRLTVRDGERGPLRVDAMRVRVRTKPERRVGPGERLVVMGTVEAQPRTHEALRNAGADVPRAAWVRARFTRPRIEEAREAGKEGAGLAHSEVRSWLGWHHPMALSLLALWPLILERRRVGGEDPGGNGVADAGDHHGAAAGPGAEPGADRGGGDGGDVAEGGGADRQVVQGDGDVPAPPLTSGHELNSCRAA
jgi:hypothetical protein